MPAYNEEGCIERVVRAWHGEVLTVLGRSKMVVVDDGSRDSTGKILDTLASELPGLEVIHQKNGGHGAALITGYNASAGAEWVFQVDSDGQFLPADFWKLWDRRAEGRFITGYRKERFDAVVRLFITRVLRLVLYLLYGCTAKDSNIPFRLIKGETLGRYLALVPEDVFIPNIFLTVIAVRSGQATLDIPVTHVARNTGKVSLANIKLAKALMRCVFELVRFRFGAYRAIKARPEETTDE